MDSEACGCREGSIAATLYLFAIPLLFVLTPLSAAELEAWGLVVAGFFVAAIAGKIFGLALARARAI